MYSIDLSAERVVCGTRRADYPAGAAGWCANGGSEDAHATIADAVALIGKGMESDGEREDVHLTLIIDPNSPRFSRFHQLPTRLRDARGVSVWRKEAVVLRVAGGTQNADEAVYVSELKSW